jgi:L-cysteine S-thiosulfotransferase
MKYGLCTPGRVWHWTWIWLGTWIWASATNATAQPAAVQPAAEHRRSGMLDMSPATQALQQDDTLNPAALWLKDGEQRFNSSCSRCHSAARLRGVAARYPAFDNTLRKPLTLSARINQCQVRYVKAAPLAMESEALLGLEVFVAHQSRGLPIAPAADAASVQRLAPFLAEGERLFRQRFGQLDFSCTQCHDQLAGGGLGGRSVARSVARSVVRLGGSTIPQGHPTGYPIYRLEWQGLGSLQRRLRGCLTGVRAEPFAYGSDELTALELYLMQRAAGLLLETPAVRP